MGKWKTTEPLNDEQRRIAEKNLGIAYAASRMVSKHMPSHTDDIDGEAVLAFVRAISHHDGREDVKPTSLAWDSCFWKAVRVREVARRRARKERRMPPGFDAVSREDGVAEVDTLDSFEALLMFIPEHHRDVLRMFYVDGLNHTECAKILGISRQGAWLWHAKALKTIRAGLEARRQCSY